MSSKPGTVDLRPDLIDQVLAVLSSEVPDAEVWAFGSRAKGTARKNSDLDLAIVGSVAIPVRVMNRLRRAFEDSRIPFQVDLVDWQRLDDDFREVVRRDHVVLRTTQANPGPADR